MVFVVPSIDVTVAKESLSGTNIKLGTQNFYFEDKAHCGFIPKKLPCVMVPVVGERQK